MLRESASGAVYRVYKDRGSGVRETRAGSDRMLDDAAQGHFTVVWRDRLARFGVAWIEKVFVGGRGYGRGPAGAWRQVAGGGVDG
jgi:putative resolvase